MSSDYVVWEPQPTRRGTLDIAIACIGTLGICVWSALHLSIPSKRPGWKANLANKSTWVLFGLLLPELLIYIALSQRLTARDIRDKVNQKLGFSNPRKAWYQRLFRSWSSERPQLEDESRSLVKVGLSDFDYASTYLTQKFDSDHESVTNPPDKIGVKKSSGDIVERKHRWTITHGFYAAMGGFALGELDSSGMTIRQVISPEGFLELLQAKPELILDISEEAICDKGKSDGLAKALLIVQVGWFCTNFISRLIQHLPVTLFEISTAAHALCSLFVYAIWWDKPLNVTDYTIIPDPDIAMSPRPSGLFWLEEESTQDIRSIQGRIGTSVFVMVGIIYGAPHFLAWNITFPTHAEQLLWRISTCVVVGVPACFSIFFSPSLKGDGYDSSGRLNVIGSFLSVLIYFPANLYLIAASLRQLFHLPPAAFILPMWSNYFPHIS